MKWITTLWLASTLLPTAQASEGVLWVEAESLPLMGGWSNDTQFVDLMGSPYLLATGVGRPVPDAVGQVQVPAAGSYRLWVRCKDWLPSHSPGRFEVLVAGQRSAMMFGHAPDDHWHWAQGGTFQLAAGPVEIRLHDSTGWWGRCDALVLAAGDFTPAEEPAALAQQRQRYGGVSAVAKECGPFDVVVVGGGLSGCGAAVAAARHGLRVALLQDRPVLGGNSSSEIQVPVEGDRSDEPWDPNETGLIEEFYPQMRDTSQSRRLARIVRGEKNLSLYLNTRATGVEMVDEQTIAAVLALDVRSGQRQRLAARVFIDCTGHGWVGYWAGAEYRVGEEARHEFHEPSAPLEATPHTMGNDLHMASFLTRRRPVPFEGPDWAYHWSSPEEFEPFDSHRRQSSGRPTNFDTLDRGRGRRPRDNDPNGSIVHCWEVEYGGMLDTIWDAEKIRDELFRIHVGLWDYAKNHNPVVHEVNRNRELVAMNFVMGVRESRRLVGDYVLSENDYIRGTLHPDTVAYTGWGADIHHPQGFWVKGNDCMHYYRYKISVPYRTLYSVNIQNLMMAGRCHSATHIGMGGTRIMRTCCEMGQAAGTAAVLVARYQTTPRAVGREHLDELQQMLLKDGCYLMGIQNHDPADLARQARATASSSAPGDLLPRDFPRGGTAHRLDRDRAVLFTASSDHIDSIDLFIQNRTDQPQRLQAMLRPAGGMEDFASQQDLATAIVEVPPTAKGWISMPLAAEVTAGRQYMVLVPTSESLVWHLYSTLRQGCCRGFRLANGTMHGMPGCYRIRLHPGGEPIAVAQPAQAGPENVHNGWNRAVHGVRNAWVPDLDKHELPQWVTLTLPEPSAVNTLHVSFQTRTDRGVDFDVQTQMDGHWHTVAEIRDNESRRRVVTFPEVTTDSVRLVLHKVAGQIGVCELRLYHEAGSTSAGKNDSRTL